MTIAAILKEKGGAVVSIGSAASVGEAARLLAERRIGAMPVIDGAGVAGIFSERDLLHAIARDGAAALDQPVAAVMTAPAISVGPDESVLGALALMTRRRIRHLPVVADGGCVGFVSIGDLVKFRIERIEADAAAMRDYIQAG
jgi:CBS domain-containing protein